MAAIFSPALPIRFWPADCLTFNEDVVDGINHECWCQPWNCDDPIVIQFTDNQGELAPVYNLYVIDSNGNLLLTVSLDKTDIFQGESYLKSVYYYSFIPSELSPEICNKKVQFIVAQSVSEDVFDNEFESNLDGWTSEGSGIGWTHDAVAFSGSAHAEAIGGGGNPEFTDYFVKNESGTSGLYRLSFDVGLTNFGSGAFDFQIIAELYDADDNILQTIYDEIFAVTISGLEPVPEILFATSGFAKIKIHGVLLTPSTFCSFYIKSVTLSKYAEDTTYKSDCHHIKTEHEETVLAEFSNNRNYAGLVYEDISPEISFSIRIPSIFYYKRNPQEDKAIERTSSTIVTSSKVKRQQLLQVIHAPDHFHEQVLLALSHHNVTIKNKLWKREEAYEKADGSQNYGLKKATVWLTEKNSLYRNVL